MSGERKFTGAGPSGGRPVPESPIFCGARRGNKRCLYPKYVHCERCDKALCRDHLVRADGRSLCKRCSKHFGEPKPASPKRSLSKRARK